MADTQYKTSFNFQGRIKYDDENGEQKIIAGTVGDGRYPVVVYCQKDGSVALSLYQTREPYVRTEKGFTWWGEYFVNQDIAYRERPPFVVTLAYLHEGDFAAIGAILEKNWQHCADLTAEGFKKAASEYASTDVRQPKDFKFASSVSKLTAG